MTEKDALVPLWQNVFNSLDKILCPPGTQGRLGLLQLNHNSILAIQ